MSDTKSNHTNPHLYYKPKNNYISNSNQIIQRNDSIPIHSNLPVISRNINSNCIIDKILPNQWIIDSTIKIQDQSNHTNPVPGINVTRLGTGGFPTRSSQVYTMNGCGIENPFSNRSINNSIDKTKIIVKDLINLSATPITQSTGDTITSANILSLFNTEVCSNQCRFNLDTTIAPNGIQKVLVNHIPDCIMNKECYGENAYWEKMNLNIASVKNDMIQLVEIVLKEIVNKSNHLKFQFTPYISPIKNHSFNSNIVLKNLMDVRKLYKENTKIASAVREDSQVYRLLFEFGVTDVYFEEKDLLSYTSNNSKCNIQTSTNNFNHVEITVACSRESTSDTTLIYVGAPDATNISSIGLGYPETLLNVDIKSQVTSIFSSRSSVIPCMDKYSTILKCDTSTDKEIIGLGVSKVDDNFNTPIYVSPSLYSIVDIKNYGRIKKIKINAKGTDIDGSIPKVNVFEAGISCDQEKCLYASGYVNNWIEIPYTLENKSNDINDDYEGNYLIIELPHINPDNICIIGGLVYYTNDNDTEEFVKEVEVSEDTTEINDNTITLKTLVTTSRLTPSLSRISSSIPSIRSNSIKSLPVLNNQYVRSSMLTNIVGAKTPIPTNNPEIPPNPIETDSINSSRLKNLLNIEN